MKCSFQLSHLKKIGLLRHGMKRELPSMFACCGLGRLSSSSVNDKTGPHYLCTRLLVQQPTGYTPTGITFTVTLTVQIIDAPTNI